MGKHVFSNEEADLKEILIADATFETADLDQEILSWLLRVALKIRGDLQETPGHTVIGNIGIKHAEKVVPESLYLFLKLVCSSDEELFDDEADDGAPCNTLHARILSIAQDVVFLASGGKKKTPKHQGIGLTIHQTTRSKNLVQILHAAGHSISYESVLRSDTAIANDAISRFNRHGHVVPRNFEGKQMPGYIRFANDNIDINEETLSGKGTFHASQTAAFLTPADETHEEELKIERGTLQSIQVPDYFLSLKESAIGTTKPEPVFMSEVSMGPLTKDHDMGVYADTKDIAWFLCRNVDRNNQKIPMWSGFNQQISTERAPQTEIGRLPIINFPAHEYDTIRTVIQNCIGMTKAAGQRHTLITFDEQLYCKAKLLQWHRPRECENLIIMLGGFHTQMNFVKVIGHFMEDSGLSDIWVESTVFGQGVAENILKGKQLNRAFRAHKMTYEALWIIFWPLLLDWCEANDYEINTESIDNLAYQLVEAVDSSDNEDIEDTVQHLSEELKSLKDALTSFDEEHADVPSVLFWRQYMEMVAILLRFTRAIRDGNWKLYISTFADMLPWFAASDHINYTRWDLIFLADMQQLAETAPVVDEGFLKGDFVVKESAHRFNQIPDDQGLEHYNKNAKVLGGFIGIAKAESAMYRWGLTFNERSRLVDDTRKMFGMLNDDDLDDDWSHKESKPARIKRDAKDVEQLIRQFERYSIFYPADRDELIGLTTGDVATDEIKLNMANAYSKGQRVIIEIIQERLADKTVSFHAPLKKLQLKSMSSMYSLSVSDKKSQAKGVKNHRDLFRRIIVSVDAGRDIDIDNFLKQELSEVPLSLASIAGSLRGTNKAQLAASIADGVTQNVKPHGIEK